MAIKTVNLDPILDILGGSLKERIPWGTDVSFLKRDGRIVNQIPGKDAYEFIIRAVDVLTNNIFYVSIEIDGFLFSYDSQEIVKVLSKEIEKACDTINDRYVESLVQTNT